MNCHFVYDHIAGKVFIPECWGGVLGGPGNCDCIGPGTVAETDTLIKSVDEGIEACHKQIRTAKENIAWLKAYDKELKVKRKRIISGL